MKITKTHTRQILVGISISLAIALSGCGSNGADNSALKTNSTFASLETRGVTTLAPEAITVIPGTITYHSVEVNITQPQKFDDLGFDGFYVHQIKLPYGATTIPSISNWATELNARKACITKKDEPGALLSDEPSIPRSNYKACVDHLDANTTYALIPASYFDYGVGGGATSAKRDLLAKSYVIFTTPPAPLPDPCLNVTGWYNHSNQVFKTRWVTDTFGAHPTWCYMKDKKGEPVFDGARLWRVELDEQNQTIAGTLTELQPDPHGGTPDTAFDTERDFFDCPLEENHTYQYILQAYNLASDGTTKIYHDKNVTANVTMDPAVIPERDCESCIHP